MKTEAHNLQILKMLLDGHALTHLDALHEFDCSRLGARVWDLRWDHGVDVQDRWIKTKRGKRIKQYFLDQKEIDRLREEKPLKQSHHTAPKGGK